jgi:hypothetical protein
LTPLHKKKKKIYCRTKKIIPRNNKKIYWNNETIFKIKENRTIIFIIKDPGKEKEYINKNLKSIFKNGKISVDIWSYFYRNKIDLFYILPVGENIITKKYK